MEIKTERMQTNEKLTIKPKTWNSNQILILMPELHSL